MGEFTPGRGDGRSLYPTSNAADKMRAAARRAGDELDHLQGVLRNRPDTEENRNTLAVLKGKAQAVARFEQGKSDTADTRSSQN